MTMTFIFHVRKHSFQIKSNFQSCAMIFDSDGNSGEFVDLVAEKLNYLGPKDLTQYFIRQTSMNKTMKGSIKVEVVLGRRLLGTVLTVYIPTILLIIIAHTTNYFKSFKSFANPPNPPNPSNRPNPSNPPNPHNPSNPPNLQHTLNKALDNLSNPL